VDLLGWIPQVPVIQYPVGQQLFWGRVPFSSVDIPSANVRIPSKSNNVFFLKGKSVQKQQKSEHFLNFSLQYVFVIGTFTLAPKGKSPSQ